MPTLRNTDFSRGWIPSADAVQGPDNGLVLMDNLTLNEDNVVSLTRGTLKDHLSQFANPVVEIFTKFLNQVPHKYVHHGTGATQVVDKDVNEAGTYATNVLTGGTGETAFGSSLGNVWILSGTQKKKDDGSTIRNLGVEVPDVVVTTNVEEKPVLALADLKTDWTVSEGTKDATESSGSILIFDTSDGPFRGIAQVEDTIDATAYPDGVTVGGEEDIFSLDFRAADSAKMQLVRVEFLLEPIPATAAEFAENYYFAEWNFKDELELSNKGRDVWTKLNTRREDFIRRGPDNELDWSNIQAIRVIIEADSKMEVGIGDLTFEGGQGALNGIYEYLQVNVFESDSYVAVSPVGPTSPAIKVSSQPVKITVDTPDAWLSESNKIYIYRRNLGQANPLIEPVDWILVAIREDVSEFTDNVSDRDAIEGITGSNTTNLHPNFFLGVVPNFVFELVDNHYGRQVYLTQGQVYFSDFENPDAIDERLTVRLSGANSEINLWAIKTQESSIYIGTTRDIYEISGIGQIFPDGTNDIFIRPLHVEQPPISVARTSYNGTVIYMSHAGWRTISGTQDISITGATHMLYEGETRYGIPPVEIDGDNRINYDCVVHKDKLYTTVTLEPGNLRRCFVYDLKKQYWYPYFVNPVSLHVMENGRLLGGFGDSGDYWVRQLDVGNYLDNEPEHGGDLQQFHLRTTYSYDELPDTRKDTEVLRLYADTQGEYVNVKVAIDGNDTFIDLGNFQFSGPTWVNIDLEDTAAYLGKSFSIDITSLDNDPLGTGVHQFFFYEWQLEYTSRPKQRNFLRVPPTDYGVAGRKRFYDMPFSCDGLGNEVTVTPVLDGVSLTPEVFSMANRKDFYTIAFREETIGHELGLLIEATDNAVFEFYELIQPRFNETLPDPVRWFRIPYTNLEKTGRKRWVRIALVIDTQGKDVYFTPLIDDFSLPTETINTERKATWIYYVKTEVTGTDVGGILDAVTDTAFEFYGLDYDETVTEVLPEPSRYIYADTDFDTSARKRFSRFSFIANPRGGTIEFTPILDGVRQTTKSYTGNRKETFDYFYIEDDLVAGDLIFRDLAYELKSTTPFEFYKLLRPERLEVLPEPVKYFRIPRTNLDTDARKRFVAFAFFINTRGHDVTFQPSIDNVDFGSPSTVNTTSEATYIHYFNAEAIGHDIGGTLSAADSALAFEFYGINFDETISEKVPGPAKYLVIPPTNYEIAAKKRIRTIPFIINTRGGTVRFTPTVDGVSQTPSTHTTSEKRTVLHFFETDVFGIDYGAIIESTDDTAFEFYDFLRPENVHTLPVAKKFDQIGPIEFVSTAWIRRLRVRLYATGTSLDWRIYQEDSQPDSPDDSGTITTTPLKEISYDIPIAPGINSPIFRIELQSTDEFHRIYLDIWHAPSGDSTNNQIRRTRHLEDIGVGN